MGEGGGERGEGPVVVYTHCEVRGRGRRGEGEGPVIVYTHCEVRGRGRRGEVGWRGGGCGGIYRL